MNPSAQLLRDLSGGWQWLFWRGLALIVVVVLGVVGLSHGVELSERPGIPDSPIYARLYYTIGLFVFGGLDLGVPQGGPGWAQAFLWFSFFAAPLITTSALIEGVLLVLRPQAWRLKWISRHIVIGGCGRLTLLYLEELHKRHPRQPTLVIESIAENPHAPAVAKRRHCEVLYGDVRSDAVLRSIRLQRANGVVLLTGDDYANLDAASRICQMRPDLASSILVHVSDIRLLRMIEQNGILPDVRKFNSFRSAAEHLVDVRLVPHFELTEAADAVVLAGFGRFGQTVLDELQRRAAGKFETVVLMDLDAHEQLLVFDEQVGLDPGYRHIALTDDLRHPDAWQRVEEHLVDVKTEPVFILGCGNDSVNIRTAMWLTSTYPEAKIVARCFYPSAFTNDLAQQCGFRLVSTAELLRARLEEWLEEG